MPLAVIAAAVVLVVVGVVVFLTHRYDDGVTVGVASYQPLESLDTSLSTGGGVLWSGTAVLGLGLFALGLVVLAGALGFLLGRRSAAGRASQ